MANKKRSFFERLIAMVLTFAIVIGIVPVNAFAATGINAVNQVADNGTINGWQQYFGTGTGGRINTEYAGAIWTDKSVYTDETLGNAFSDVRKSSMGGAASIAAPAEDNFLVSLSALSSTKEIVGYSNLPTDTVLVLDMSNSMSDDDLKAMVQAANAAITKLYATSNYNRVGVVTYNRELNTLLPIDRYTAGTNNNNPYLTINGRTISISNGVKNSDGNRVTKSITGTNGTYTQAGLYHGLQEFLKVTDTSIETGTIQGGTKRIPVMVLMTDGDPTYGSSNYLEPLQNNRNSDDYTTDEEVVFLTQLTAAYVHNEMERHYGRECLFYTLGLGVSGDYAPQVLNPTLSLSDVATTVARYWQTYRNAAKGARLCTYGGKNVNKLTDQATGEALYNSRFYSDGYFSASNSQGLITAFDDIVTEIILQSKYYPTLVSSGNYDMDGYVSIVDELGEFMELKSARGIVLGDTLYTGEAFVKAAQDGAYGNLTTWSEYGWELVYSISERLNVTNDQAIALLRSAWQEGQLSYTAPGVYSNYISYYVSADNKNLGFHSESHTQESYPEGTKYIGYSYLFQGLITNTGSNLDQCDMLHIVANVFIDVETGHQTVTWRVPAALVPLVQYKVTLEGNVLNETSRNVKLTEISNTPIRFLYEVGLNDEITPITLAGIMADENTHKHPTGDGGYYFYSNRWGNGHGVTELDPNNEKAAIAHYNPSEENERYYYAEDSIIYLNGTQYKGRTAPAGTGYTHALYKVSATASNSNATVTAEYVPINAETLKLAQPLRDYSGNITGWYIPKGTLYRDSVRSGVLKTENITGTIKYVDYPVINNEGEYAVHTFLGNNGRLTVYPTQGLKLTKAIDNVIENTQTDNFVFDITFDRELTAAELAAVAVTDPDYNDKAYTVSGTNPAVITVTLANNETVYITGLPVGVSYTITEKAHDDYIIQTITNNGTGTVADNVIAEFTAVNTERRNGSLSVSKTVTHPYGENYNIPDNRKFDIVVNLFDAEGNPYTAATLDTVVPAGVTTAYDPATGTFTVQLAHNQSVLINNLPAGTTYTVTETNLGEGFTLDTAQSSALAGTIVADTQRTEHIVNKYAPSQITSADFELWHNLSKTLTGREWQTGDKFVFELYKYDTSLNNGQGGWVTTGKTKEIAPADTDIGTKNVLTLSFEITEGFETIGTYWYKTVEVNNNIPGVTYDPTEYIFGVVVTDDELTGLTVSDVISGAASTVVDKTKNGADEDVFSIDMPFENTYSSTGSTNAVLNVQKNIVNNSGAAINYNQFSFGLYTKAVDGTLVPYMVDTNGDGITDTHLVAGADAVGKAEFVLNFTKSDLPASSATLSVMTPEPTPTPEATETPEPTATPEETPAPEVTPEETPAPEVTPEETPAPEVTPEETTVPEVTPEETTVPEVTPEETTAPEVTPEETSAPEATVEAAPASEPAPAAEVETTPAPEVTPTPEAVQEETAEVAETAETVQPLSLKGMSLKVTDQAAAEQLGTVTPFTTITVEDESSDALIISKAAPTSAQFTFVIKEMIPDGYVPGTGVWEYDTAEREVVVTVTGQDNGKGVFVMDATVDYTPDDDTTTGTEATFTNKYTPKPADIDLKGKKVFTGRTAKPDDEFVFLMYRTDSSHVVTDATPVAATATVTGAQLAASADGTVVFDFISTNPSAADPSMHRFDKVGNYYFVIREQNGGQTVNGVTFDNSEYWLELNVTVVNDEVVVKETLTKVAGDAANGIVFTNTYTATGTPKANFTATKRLDGRALTENDFTFSLYPATLGADGKLTADTSATAIETVGNTANQGVINFSEITYPQENKTYYYAIVENNEGKGGITYDTAPEFVKVVVSDDGKGNWTSATTYVDVNDNPVSGAEFNNTYRITTPNSVVITGNKAFVDRDNNQLPIDAGDFQFVLWPADSHYAEDMNSTPVIVPINRDGTFEFTQTYERPGTHYYVLREYVGHVPTISYDETRYHVMVVAVDNGDGTLTVMKNITDAAGNQINNFTSDSNREFVNVYIPQDTGIIVPIIKNIANNTGATVSGENFKFGIFESLTGTPVATAYTDADGRTALGLQFKDTDIPEGKLEAEKTYYIREIIKDRNGNGIDDEAADKISGMEYDTTVYKLVVKLSYNSSNQMTATHTVTVHSGKSTVDADGNLVFTNTYELDPAYLTISGDKEMTGKNVADGEFEFALYEAEYSAEEGWARGAQIGNNIRNGADATFAFPQLSYTRTGTHYYIVQEVTPHTDSENMAYDRTQRKITVSVTDGGNGKLKAEIVSVEGNKTAAEDRAKDITFNNVFTPSPVFAEISGKKVLSGRDFTASDVFTFELYETGADYKVPASAAPFATQTVTARSADNATGGKLFTFDGIEFTADGPMVRYFVVREVNGSDPTITYSAERNVRINAKLNETTGVIDTTVTTWMADGLVSMTNTYHSKETSATVGVRKYITNDTNIHLTRDGYQVGIYTDETCKTPYTENGTAVILTTDTHGYAEKTFVYTDKDYNPAAGADKNVYTYYLKEIVPSPAMPGMDYDKAVYKYTVELEYNEHKELVVKNETLEKVGAGPLSSNPLVAVHVAGFVNTYTVNPATAIIHGTKDLVDDAETSIWNTADHKDKTFEIELYHTGGTMNYATGELIAKETVTNTDRGFEFNAANTANALQFTKAGTYYFAVRETNSGSDNGAGKYPGVRYDGKEYGVEITVGLADGTNNLTVTSEKYYLNGMLIAEALDYSVDFENTYPAKDGLKVEFTGNKILTGRDIRANEFSFMLFKADTNWTVPTVPYRTVHNTATADMTENQAQTGFTFGEITFTEPGTYRYVVKEASFHNPTLTYDDNSYRITVVIKDKTATELEVDSITVTKHDKDGKQIDAGTTFTKDDLNFTNSYTPVYADAKVDVLKNLTNVTGVNIPLKGFEFGLYENENCTVKALDGAGNHITVTTDENGKAQFTFSYGDEDVYGKVELEETYYIKEIPGSKAGMIYDGAVYKVDITVTYVAGADGIELVATPVVTRIVTMGEHAEADTAEFDNIYALHPAYIDISGRKVLPEHTILDSDFTFQLYTAVADEEIWTTDILISEAVNNEQTGEGKEGDYDKFTFEEVGFATAGTYNFIITEEKGLLNGVTYDQSVYQVTVTVVPDDTKVNGEPDTVDDDGDGMMNDLVAQITSIEKVTYDEDGVPSVTAVENLTGTPVQFNNSYTPKDVFDLSGDKTIVNREWNTDDEFTFSLYETDADFKVDKNAVPVATAKATSADKAFTFTDVAIVDDVTHYYVIVEEAGDAHAMTYDETRYYVTVEAKDNGDGTMTLGRTVDGTFIDGEYLVEKATERTVLFFFRSVDKEEVPMDEIEFVNIYNTVPVAATIIGNKELTGSVTGRQIKEGEFTFQLWTATVENGRWYEEDRITAVSNSALKAGETKALFTFNPDDIAELNFSAVGEHFFIVKEQKGTNPVVGYDATEHNVKVVVSEQDNPATADVVELAVKVLYVAEGGAEIEISDPLTQADLLGFTNTYSDATVYLPILKVIRTTGNLGHTAEGFNFRVVNADTGAVVADKLISGPDGRTGFTLAFTDSDIGKTYTYKITEISGNISNMKYDETVYTVVVKVTAEDGQLVTDVTVDGAQLTADSIVFTNTYSGNSYEPGDVPDTGDTTNTMMWASVTILAAVLLIALLLYRKKSNADR